ncbi:MAG: monooxygenase [Actinomycetes bacterium]
MTKQLVVLDTWTVAPKHVARAFMYMGLHRRPMRKVAGLSFWKLLGTGSGRTFTMRDANPKQWAVLTVWANHDDYKTFTTSKMFKAWQSIATGSAHAELEPLSTKGTWAGQTPFIPEDVTRWTGPTAALTRARIKPRWWISFWRSVPPVSIDLHNTAGLLATLGIGEAPVGLQGTFSIWQNTDAITQFASRQAPHQAVVARTHQTGWYAEELFARFKVLTMSGTLDGVDLSQVSADE